MTFGTARDVDAAPYFRLISSDIPEVSDRGVQLFILKSIKFTNLVLRHIPELKTVLTTLCSSTNVRWGTVSSLLLAVSNTVAVERSDCYFLIHDLFSLCQIVSSAFFSAPVCGPLRPHLVPLVQTISKLVRSRPPDILVLLALTEQCMIGFTPKASFIPFMSQMAKDIVAVITVCDPVHYDALSEPISSTRRSVVRFYTMVWAWAIGSLIGRPPALAALARHSATLIRLTAHTDGALAAAAKYILDCVKVEPPVQAARLPPIGGSLSQMIDKALKVGKAKPVELPKQLEEAFAVPPPAAPKPAGPDLSTLAHDAAVMVVGKGKKKSQLCRVKLMPDARLIAWGQGTEFAEGEAMDLLDVKGVSILAQKVLRVETGKTGQVVQFTFNEQRIAEAWKTALQDAVKIAS
jgi:hypothetical protein